MRIVETLTHYIPKDPCKTAAQMEEVCCTATDELQCCEEMEKEWSGYSADEIADEFGLDLDSQGRDSEGVYVKIIFKARENPCGEQLTKYDYSGKNCCDEIEPLEVYKDGSIQVLADYSSGIVILSEPSVKELTVSVRGNGFYADATTGERDVKYKSGANGVAVQTRNACGTCKVVISDGCSEVTHYIKSTNGQWITREFKNIDDAPGPLLSLFEGPADTWEDHPGFAEVISVREQYEFTASMIVVTKCHNHDCNRATCSKCVEQDPICPPTDNSTIKNCNRVTKPGLPTFPCETQFAPCEVERYDQYCWHMNQYTIREWVC